MKRFSLVLALVLLAAACFGQVTYVGDPYLATFSWNAVATKGEPPQALDPGDVIEYELVYAAPDHSGVVSYGVTPATELQVAVPPDGPWDIGVQAILTTDEGQTVLFSGFTWLGEEGQPDPTLLRRASSLLPNRPTIFHITIP